jgi:hypothetical protein
MTNINRIIENFNDPMIFCFPGDWEGWAGLDYSAASAEGVQMVGTAHRVHTEWQRPLSSVHSIMTEKLAHPLSL